MSKDFSRRKFLGSLAAGGAASAHLPWLANLAAAAEEGLPHRNSTIALIQKLTSKTSASLQ